MTLIEQVQKALTPDLLKKRYRGLPHPHAGHCYVASEALYHLLGGKKAGWKPMSIRHEDTPHWFLLSPAGEVVDATAGQFKTPVPYDQARGKGFLTRHPSKRAQLVIDRVRERT